MDSKHDLKSFRGLLLGLAFLCIAPIAVMGESLVILNNNRQVADIFEGEIYNGAIVVSNTTEQDLKIINIRSTCGCTVLGKVESTIPPKGTDSFSYSFNSMNYNGSVNRRIILNTENENFVFAFSVNVRSLAHLPDNFVDLGTYKTLTNIRKEIQMTIDSSCKKPVVEFPPTDPLIKSAEIRKSKSGGYLLRLIIRPENNPEQYIRSVTVDIVCGKTKKRLNINISGKYQP